MYITRLQLNIGSGLSDSIIDGCFTTTCGGLLRLRLGWKIILVVVFIVVVAIVGIVSIRIVVKVILICWKIRGFMIVSHRNWNKIFPWLKNIIFSLKKLSFKKTTKHLEFSIWWLTPPPSQHMENLSLLLIV